MRKQTATYQVRLALALIAVQSILSILSLSNLQRPDRLITKLKSINFDENTRQKLVIVRQPRNADEKSKGFTSARVERAPGTLLKAQN